MKPFIPMKKITFFALLVLFVTGCNISQQAKEIKTLADCRYTIVGVDNIFVSGTDVKKIIANRDMNLGSIPSLALGFISKNIPLKADLKIGITNPTSNHAAINYFDYEILVNKQRFTEGTVNERINIAPDETIEVDFPLNTNIYQFLVNDSIRNDIQEFITAASNQSEVKSTITLRIKPAIYIGDEIIKYPGFIDIEKEINSSLFFRR